MICLREYSIHIHFHLMKASSTSRKRLLYPGLSSPPHSQLASMDVTNVCHNTDIDACSIGEGNFMTSGAVFRATFSSVCPCSLYLF